MEDIKFEMEGTQMKAWNRWEMEYSDMGTHIKQGYVELYLKNSNLEVKPEQVSVDHIENT